MLGAPAPGPCSMTVKVAVPAPTAWNTQRCVPLAPTVPLTGEGVGRAGAGAGVGAGGGGGGVGRGRPTGPGVALERAAGTAGGARIATIPTLPATLRLVNM